MSEQSDTHGIERVIFEPAGEGKWRMRLEGADVEGHAAKIRFRSAEPAGEADGEALYELSFEGEDVEGHRWRASDARLKRDVATIRI